METIYIMSFYFKPETEILAAESHNIFVSETNIFYTSIYDGKIRGAI